jgi:hypothetical protein
MRRLFFALAFLVAVGGSVVAYNVLTTTPAVACPYGSSC